MFGRKSGGDIPEGGRAPTRSERREHAEGMPRHRRPTREEVAEHDRRMQGTSRNRR